MMRVAYLVTAYRDLVHLQRLCDALGREDPGALLVVQFDRGSPLAPRAAALGERVRFTQRPITWGDGSYVRAVVDSLRAMLDEPWDWVVVLSGQDYPVRPLDGLHAELEQGGHSAYALTSGCLPGDVPPPQALVTRYHYRYWWTRRPWPRALRALARRSAPVVAALSRQRVVVQPRPRGAGPGLGVRRRATIFSDARPCCMGSDYVAISRSSTEAMLDILRCEPEVLDYFASTFVPSEAMFASMVRWVDPTTVADLSLHFMHFRGRANPRQVSEDDLGELWRRGVYFARKFDDEAAWVEQRLPMRRSPS
jgi:hypothetical protein